MVGRVRNWNIYTMSIGRAITHDFGEGGVCGWSAKSEQINFIIIVVYRVSQIFGRRKLANRGGWCGVCVCVDRCLVALIRVAHNYCAIKCNTIQSPIYSMLYTWNIVRFYIYAFCRRKCWWISVERHMCLNAPNKRDHFATRIEK